MCQCRITKMTGKKQQNYPFCLNQTRQNIGQTAATTYFFGRKKCCSILRSIVFDYTRRNEKWTCASWTVSTGFGQLYSCVSVCIFVVVSLKYTFRLNAAVGIYPQHTERMSSQIQVVWIRIYQMGFSKSWQQQLLLLKSIMLKSEKNTLFLSVDVCMLNTQRRTMLPCVVCLFVCCWYILNYKIRCNVRCDEMRWDQLVTEITQLWDDSQSFDFIESLVSILSISAT